MQLFNNINLQKIESFNPKMSSSESQKSVEHQLKENESSEQLQNPYNDLKSDGQQESYKQEQGEGFSIYGINFCQVCQNLLYPYKSMQSKLQFHCVVCNDSRILDYTDRYQKECAIYNKQLQPGSKKTTVDQDFVFDPTMPRIKVSCPTCAYEQAVYFLSPDDGERKIVATAICANATESLIKCDATWRIDESHPIYNKIFER